MTGTKSFKKPGGKLRDVRAKIDRNKALIERRAQGAGVVELSHEFGIAPQRVSQIIVSVRNAVKAESKEIMAEIRDKEMYEILALRQQWLPIALQPIKLAAVHRITPKGNVVEMLPCYNEPAKEAAEIIIKSGQRLGKLLGYDVEKGNQDEGKSPQDLLVWIQQQINVQQVVEKQADGKVITKTEERFGKLELRAGGDADEL